MKRAQPRALSSASSLLVLFAALGCSDVLGLEELSEAEPCDGCSAAECGEPLASCNEDDRCTALLGCLEQCAPDDPCCPADCAQQHPSAEALTVMACVCERCAEWCGMCTTGATDAGTSSSCRAGGAGGGGGAGGQP